MPTVPSDIDIARQATLQPIETIAKKLDLAPDELIHYGPHIAKIDMKKVKTVLEKPARGKLVLVSAITPTPAGEGKTTISVGLTQALHELGIRVSAALREPSLGPCMGVKGGATGGGYAQVLPMEAINLHFTGDIHAVTTAHNLVGAMIDQHIYYGNDLNLDLNAITWRRVMDMNDRSLRVIQIGLGSSKNGIPRETGFDITAASEIMAILCLASGYNDLKKRLSAIVIGYTPDGKAVRLGDLQVVGAVAALLKDAMQPNLVQTIGGAPVFIHGGPFANIAQGANSILATRLALGLSDVVVTEAGFGFDLGGEKFFDLVSPMAGFYPGAVVLVATVRALKMHGGIPKDQLKTPDPAAVLAGRANLEKHIQNVRVFGVEPVVAINRFITDSEEEVQAIEHICRDLNAQAIPVTFWADGGRGGLALGKAVMEVLSHPKEKRIRLYEPDWPIEKKIEKVAKTIYGADEVIFQPTAVESIRRLVGNNLDRLPICISKTQNSLSDNPKLMNRPTGFSLTVRDVLPSAGAGFLVVLTGELMRMPGLPQRPAAMEIDIDDDGNISGLF